MDFQLTDDQQAFVEMARGFARDNLEPNATEWDQSNTFPVDVLKSAAELGLAAIYTSETYGGTGLTRMDAALIFEALAEGCISTSAYLSIHNMVTSLIDAYGTDELRAHWIPKLVTMDAMASYCLTEPSSGSDAASLKTTAIDDGDDFIINGSKSFISGAGNSDVYLCMVRTDGDGYQGISAILIEKDTPGLTFGTDEKKLGWHSQPTKMVFFENCRVPKHNIIGARGQGFKIALNALNGGRINIAACSLGGARACLEHTHRYMQEREQFNKPLHAFQALRFKYTDLYTQFKAARLMTYRAASSLDNPTSSTPMDCAMAKRITTDSCFEIANQCLQIFGGYGYLADYPIERIFRDLRVHQILEGTNEIMREIVGKELFKHEELMYL